MLLNSSRRRIDSAGFLKRPSLTFLLIAILCSVLFSLAGGQPRPDSRDKTEQPHKVIEVTGVKSGMVVGEVGAGSGYFTFWLAHAVGITGKVYANDIRKSGLDAINYRAEREWVTNIETVLGTVDNPRFPQAALDMVFMINSYHEFEKPTELLANLLPSLKPGAIVVVMDRDPERTWKSSEHIYTRKEMAETIGRSAFELVRTETFLPWHNLYILRAKKSGRPAS